jgi:cytochrome c oxidase subunit 2
MFKFSLFLQEIFFSNRTTNCDFAEPWQLSFQDPATAVMEGIINLHHDIMFVLWAIFLFVSWVLFRATTLFDESKNQNPTPIVHGTTIEILWTVLPAGILIIIAVPSFALLYSIDELIDPAVTIKAVGHQWSWSYEYSDYSNEDGETINFDSYMLPEDDLEVGQLRLLEVDNRITLPVQTHVRIVVTSADVLHAWALPSFGVKMDACPGRLNQTSVFVKREGVYYGQCSELCGINHGFMPIVVEAVSLDDYVQWITAKLEDA